MSALNVSHARTLPAVSSQRLIGQLQRVEDRHAAHLADLLKSCTEQAPCQSAACPACGAAFQQAAVRAVDELICKPAREIRNRMSARTIVPASGIVEPADLTVDIFERVGAEVLADFAKLQLPPAIIGLEASFNEDLTERIPPHWCVHPHAIQLDWLSPVQEAGLRAAFPPSPYVKRPVRNDPLDHKIAGRLYPFKWERCRRVTFINASDPKRAPYRDTKHRPLRPAQAVQLALAEHQLGFGRRLLTHQIDERAVRRLLEPYGWARDGL